jgi:hypothetical protein
VLLYEIVPAEISFAEVNKIMKKKELGALIDLAYRKAGNKADGHLRRPAEGPGLRAGDARRHLHRHQGHGHPAPQGRADRAGATARSARSRTSTTRASSPTASATTRSSTSGRRSPTDRRRDAARARHRGGADAEGKTRRVPSSIRSS